MTLKPNISVRINIVIDFVRQTSNAEHVQFFNVDNSIATLSAF